MSENCGQGKEPRYQSVDIMAKELLQHPVGEQNDIMKQFVSIILTERGKEVENKNIEAKNYQDLFEGLRTVLTEI